MLPASRLGQRHLPHGSGPVPARPAQSPGTAVGQYRQQVLVPAADEGVRPRSVHVPEQDSHCLRTFLRCAERGDPAQQAFHRVHHLLRRQPSPGRDARVRDSPAPGSACTARSGRRAVPAERRTAPSGRPAPPGENRLTTGVPTAAARWAGPVFPATTTSALARTPARVRRSVRPPRSMADGPATVAVRAVLARAAGHHHPVAGPSSSSTAAAWWSGGQARAGTVAPGWTTT